MNGIKALIICVVGVCLFSGCSRHYPSTTMLELNVPSQPPGVYDGAVAAAISGSDKRQNKEIVAYRMDESQVVRIGSMEPPQRMIVENLVSGLEQQGLLFKAGSSILITVEINELIVNVTKSSMLYKSEAKSLISLSVRNHDKVFTKTYSQESYNKSAGRPKPEKLKKMLEDQLTDTVQEILEDAKIQNAIAGT